MPKYQEMKNLTNTELDKPLYRCNPINYQQSNVHTYSEEKQLQFKSSKVQECSEYSKRKSILKVNLNS